MNNKTKELDMFTPSCEIDRYSYPVTVGTDRILDRTDNTEDDSREQEEDEC